MAIVENVQRSDLNPIDRAMAFQRLLDEFGLNNAQVSQKLERVRRILVTPLDF